MKCKLTIIVYNCMSCIGSPLKTNDNIRLLSQHIRNLTFSLVAPISAHYCFNHFSSSCCDNPYNIKSRCKNLLFIVSFLLSNYTASIIISKFNIIYVYYKYKLYHTSNYKNISFSLKKCAPASSSTFCAFSRSEGLMAIAASSVVVHRAYIYSILIPA